MATCPSCNANSRTTPGFTVREELEAREITATALAGAQLKVSARMRLVLRCPCGFAVEGRIRRTDTGTEFVANAVDVEKATDVAQG